MDKKWWKSSVVYQIYPRSFCDSNVDEMEILTEFSQNYGI